MSIPLSRSTINYVQYEWANHQGEKYTYHYPNGLDLRPESELHKRLLARLMGMARDSRMIMQRRFESWDQIDEILTSYIDLTTEQREDSQIEGYQKRKPIQIVVPMSYAIRETLLTYMVGAFLEDPIVRYDHVGDNDNDVVGAKMLEKAVRIQNIRSKTGLALQTQWSDGFTYGIGAISPQWTREYAIKEVEEDERQPNFLGIMSKTGRKLKHSEPELIYEGSEVHNINPRLYLPDPNVPAHKIQQGEFVGWIRRTNIMNALDEESKAQGEIFNVRYGLQLSRMTSCLVKETTNLAADKTHRPEGSSNSSMTLRPLDRIYMYVKIIPSEWELGNGKYPEKWLFAIDGDQIIVQAKPLGLNHGRFPVIVTAPDYDGYSATPISRLETMVEMQKMVDWFFTSHAAAVRKAVDDIIVYDPYLINTIDLEKQGPRLVKMRDTAWDRGKIADSIMQFKISDVTQGHIPAAQAVAEFAYRFSAAVDSVQGIMRSGGERRSAAEAMSAHNAALSRLARLAYIISSQSMLDLGYMLGYHTQQLMTKTTYAKIVGEDEAAMYAEFKLKAKNDRIAIDPSNLQVPFDVIPHDGTAPGGQNLSALIQGFQIAATNPQIAAGLDLTGLFLHIMRESGVRNVNQFRVKVQPREQIERQAQAGNYVPAAEASDVFNGAGMAGVPY